ncbi:MAG: glutamate--tRNA ligase [Chloroflexi bacterium]|nr:glutamate--tRNA ligase [Chloroflexota bacterium]
MTVRVRMAPSPTGDPHVGTGYVALFNYALARQRGGKFVLRIEDTDRGRYVENSDQQIIETLRWLGLDWDEGPDKGGPFGPYRQSERLPIYAEAAKRLLEAGHAYYCWCSPERLQEMRADQTARKQPPGYDRLCVGKTREERSRLPGFDPTPVIRMRVPDHDVPLTFNDMIRGVTNAPMPDDQVLIKKDGFPTYHMAVVVDDHEMEITHVLRAEEWISSMPKQLLLYRYFGWEPPRFAHLPLLRNQDRSKISKRKNPAARLLWFQEEGFLPEALVNFLALQGWSMPDGREKFSFEDLIANFDVERFSPVGPIFDINKLDWMNAEYIKELSDEEFIRRAAPFLPGPGQEASLLKLAPALKTRVKRLKEVCDQVEFLYQGKLELEPSMFATSGTPSPRDALLAAEAALEALPAEPFDVATIESALEAVRSEHDWKPGPMYGPIRIALTAKTKTPPNFDMLAALGRDRSLARLRDAIAILAA